MRPVPEVEPIVKEVVARNAGVSVEDIHWETTYVQLGLIGQGKVNVILELEVIFGLTLAPHINEFITVGQTIEFISANAPGHSAPLPVPV